MGTSPGRVSSSKNETLPPHIRGNPFKLWAWKKVFVQGEDCIIGYSGKTGSGKTTLSCKHAEDFDIERDSFRKRFPYKEIVDGEDILAPRLVNSVTQYQSMKAKRKYPTGSVFIIDEAQVLLNSRDFMSAKNREMIRLLSTGRVYKHFTFINLPHWQHLDNQIKSYLHAVVICHRPNKEKGLSYYTPYLVEPMGYGKPPMTKLFRWRDRNGRLHRLDLCEDKLPSQELMDAQEKKVNTWKDLVRLGKVTSTGDIVSPTADLSPKELRQKQRLDLINLLVEQWSPIRAELLGLKGYHLVKIKAKALLSGHSITNDMAASIALKLSYLDK